MLDEILAKAIREIASNCSIGCAPTELWCHLKDTVLSNNKKIKLTDTTKTYIHKLLLNHQSITIKKNPKYIEQEAPIPSTPSKIKKEKDGDEEMEDVNKEENTPVMATPTKQQVAIKVIPSTPKTTISSWKASVVTADPNSNEINKMLCLEPSDRFVYIADKYNQTLSLGVSYDQLKSLTDVQWSLLEKISQSRHTGAIVRDLSETFNIDPRNIFVPIKDLTIKGIIDKEDITGTSDSGVTVTTGRLFLKKYFKPRQINLYKEQYKPRYFVKAAILRYLELEPTHILPMTTIVKKLDFVSTTTFKKNKKWLLDNEFISQNEEKGPVKLKLEKGIDEHFWSVIEGGIGEDDENEGGGATPKKGKATTPKKSTATTANTENGEEGENGGEGGEDDNLYTGSTSNLYMEMPIYQQIFNIVRYAGSSGITQKEITMKVGEASLKFVTSVLKTLICSYRVKLIPDTVGRQLVYRVFADPTDYDEEISTTDDPNLLFRNIDDFQPIQFNSRLLDFDELILESNKNTVVNSQLRQITNGTTKTPKKEDNSNIPHIEEESNEDSGSSGGEEESDSVGGIVKSSSSSTKFKKRAMPQSVLFINRKAAVYRRIVESRGSVMYALLNHQHSIGDTTIDVKSLKRVIEALIAENKISLVKLYGQNLRGAHKRLIFVFDSKYNIDDPQIQEIIETIKDIPSKCKNLEADGSQSVPAKNNTGDGVLLIQQNVTSSKHFSVTATRYGFIKGVIVRAKLLHQFIWSFACKFTNGTLLNRNVKNIEISHEDADSVATSSSSSSSISKEAESIGIKKELGETTRIFLNLLLKYLTITDYLKIVSQNSEIEDLDEYIKKNTLIIDLPQSIKTILFQNNSFMNKLSPCVSLLIKLGLISKGITYGYTEYTFNRNVELMFDNGTIKKYDFHNFETLKTYWSDLQFLSLLPKDQNSTILPSNFICNKIPILLNILMWGVPKVQLTEPIKQALSKHFAEKRSISKDDIKELSARYNVSGYKVLAHYRKVKQFKQEELRLKLSKLNKHGEEDSNESDSSSDSSSDSESDGENQKGSGGVRKRRGRRNVIQLKPYDSDDEERGEKGIFRRKGIQKIIAARTKVSKCAIATQEAKAKRKEIKKQLLPYSRFKWTSQEDSQLLKHYTEIFTNFFQTIPEGVKNNPNSEYFITPSGIPSMLNPLWDRLGTECNKLGQLCYRRMKLLVKKYPSYKTFHKNSATPELPLTIKEFNTLFNYHYSKHSDLEIFEQSKFDDIQDSITRDKILFLISIPEEEYSYALSTRIIGPIRKETSKVMEALTYDRIIRNYKSKTTERTLNFCVQKINFKTNSLNKEFFQENRVFMSNIKEIPIIDRLSKFDNNELFQYDPLTSGGSVSAMLFLLNINKVLPVISVKDNSKNEKAPKSRDLSNGGQRLDLMLNKIVVAYQILDYIDYSYIENERKRAINPDVIININDPLESIKKKFQIMFKQDDGDDNNNDDDDNEIIYSKKRRTVNDDGIPTSTTIINQLMIEFYDKFEFEDFKQLFKTKIDKIIDITERNGRYIGVFVLMIQEIFKFIHSKGTQDVTRKDIINHFVNSSNHANEILQQLIHLDDTSDSLIQDGEYSIDHSEYIYQNLLNYILELKSLGIIDTHFTFHNKVYISKSNFQDSLLPNDYTLQQLHSNNNAENTDTNTASPISLDYRIKKLFKPWVDINGKVNRTLFNKMFFEFASNLHLYPGSTLENISHRLQKYSPSLLKEVAIILQSLDYITVLEFDYIAPTLFTPAKFITRPFNHRDDGNINLILQSTPKFFNIQADFSVYLLTEDF